LAGARRNPHGEFCAISGVLASDGLLKGLRLRRWRLRSKRTAGAAAVARLGNGLPVIRLPMAPDNLKVGRSLRRLAANCEVIAFDWPDGYSEALERRGDSFRFCATGCSRLWMMEIERAAISRTRHGHSRRWLLPRAS